MLNIIILKKYEDIVMKLKHKILPLLFLGLSPGAGKVQNSVSQDSTKILHTEVFTPEEQQKNDKG